MLDLDHLAEQRAEALRQPPEEWRRAVWSDAFQKLSQNMSDGEVVRFLSFCPTSGHVEVVARLLDERAGDSGLSPFSLLMEEAVRAGLEPEEWVRKALATGMRS